MRNFTNNFIKHPRSYIGHNYADIFTRIYLSIDPGIFSRFGGWLQHLSISLMSSAILLHSCSFSPLQLLMFSSQLIRFPSRSLVPSTLPWNISFKRLCCFLTWPKYFAFLSLTYPTNGLFTPWYLQYFFVGFSLFSWHFHHSVFSSTSVYPHFKRW